MNYHTIILGAGPAGYTTALELAKAGKKVALIEKKRIGGTCTNSGCIPTKTLLSSVECLENIQTASRKGIVVSDFKIDFQKVSDRKNRIIQTLVKGMENQLKNQSIDFYNQEGHILSPNQVQVGEQVLDTEYIVIATGSEPIQIWNADKIVTSEKLLGITSIPNRLVIIGGGVIGVELSQIFQAFGSQVTIIEALPTILSNFDGDIQKEGAANLKRKGITIKTNTSATYQKGQLKAGEETIAFDLILVAVGRKAIFPKTELDKIGVECTDKKIKVDSQLKTNIPNIFAIGDVTGQAQLAHVAVRQGTCAANTILGKSDSMNYQIVPQCIYTLPEIGSVGLREEETKPDQTIIKKALYAGNAKARCSDHNTGFIKIIIDKSTQKIIGAHIVGERATDLILHAEFLIQKEATIKDIQKLIHPHPTFGELFIEAFL